MTSFWIVITCHLANVHFKVADETGKEVFGGTEPIGALNDPRAAAQAATRASMAASMYAAMHGKIEGYELLG